VVNKTTHHEEDEIRTRDGKGRVPGNGPVSQMASKCFATAAVLTHSYLLGYRL
jgi:hypothetical protein